MNIQEFGELINELNEILEGNKFFDDTALCFNYRNYGYVDVVLFGDFVVFCSEVDSTYDYDKNRDISVKEIVIKNFKKYRKALKTIKLK